MKAIPIAGLTASTTLEDAARRMVGVRAEELFAFLPSTLDPRERIALHEMRIAAKRLRYVLELVGFCLGEVAIEATDAARELQSVIGEIHDCDVLAARLARRPDHDERGMRMLAKRNSERRAEHFRAFTQLAATLERAGLHRRLREAAAADPGTHNGTAPPEGRHA
jgi:CHAD domain-containing protein